MTRTYRETITDAIEACFSFKFLNLSDYLADTILAEGVSYEHALEAALRLEEKASRFYMDVAERSGSLLATIPFAFRKVGEMRNRRKARLRMLADRLE